MDRLFRPMAMALALGSSIAACSSSSSSSPVTPPPVTPRTYTNPVIDHLFPDPTIFRAEDGWFYVYGTQDDGEDTKPRINIQVARSQNLVDWERLGDALPVPPAWARKTDGNYGYWAPDVVFLEGKYVLHFTGELDDPDLGRHDMCIGAATADSPSGPFQPSDDFMICGTQTDPWDNFDWSTIDPMVFKDPVSHKVYMYWGSMHLPLHVQELTPDGLAFLDGSASADAVKPNTKRPYEGMLEAPWLHYRAPYYYLFFSGDEAWTHYVVMVARASSPTGPFVMLADAMDRASSAILEPSGRWDCPGHNSVIRDDDGTDWIFYHAMDMTTMPDDRPPHPTRVLLMPEFDRAPHRQAHEIRGATGV